MSQRHLYLYCSDIRRGQTGPWCEAVLLSPHPFQYYDVQSFPAFLLDSRLVIPIKCRVGVTEFASGQDEYGQPVMFFDGEVHRHDLTADAVSTAQNKVILHLDGITLAVSGPALISTDERVGFVRCSLVVDLLCTTLVELPDFIANLDHLRSFEESLRDPAMPRPATTYADELQGHAKGTRLSPGFVLPVSSPNEDGDKSGAVILGRQLSSSQPRFAAHLYMFHADYRLEPGILLSRRVTWVNGSHEQTRSCPVARVVSVTEHGG